ncbi:DUF1559 domain-containing protein [Pirellulaceae bacterium SH449]
MKYRLSTSYQKPPYIQQLLGVAAIGLSCTGYSSAQEIRPLFSEALNPSSILLIKVNSSQLEIPESIKELSDGQQDKPIATMVDASERNFQVIRELMNGQTVCVSLDMPYTAAVLLRAVAPKSVATGNLEKIVNYVAPDIGVVDRSTSELTKLDIGSDLSSGATVASGVTSAAQAAKWEAALEATKEFPVQCVLLLPEYVVKTFQEINPDLPEILGGGSAEWLLNGAQWISIGVNTKNATARIVVQSRSEESAKVFAQNVPKLLRSILSNSVENKETSLALSVLFGLIKPEQSGDRVVLTLTDDEQNLSFVQFGASVASSMLAPISANTTANRLKQFALGFHNYESAYQAIPTYAEMVKTKEKSGLSWRVHILPFIGFPELYQEFKLAEAWDSPHNIKLLAKMPAIYRPLSDMNENVELAPYHTTYVAPIGSKTVFGQEEPMYFRDITDGLSNTIAFVELKPEHAIPWTSPEEYPYDEADPTAKLRDYNGKTVIALFDGAVLNLKLSLPKETWLALLTRNGGEVVELD